MGVTYILGKPYVTHKSYHTRQDAMNIFFWEYMQTLWTFRKLDKDIQNSHQNTNKLTGDSRFISQTEPGSKQYHKNLHNNSRHLFLFFNNVHVKVRKFSKILTSNQGVKYLCKSCERVNTMFLQQLKVDIKAFKPSFYHVSFKIIILNYNIFIEVILKLGCFLSLTPGRSIKTATLEEYVLFRIFLAGIVNYENGK